MSINFSFYFFLIVILLSINNLVHSDELIFDTKKIQILNNGNITIAENGNAKIIDKNIIFIGDKFLLNKLKQTLEIDKSKIFLNNHNISIKANKVFYNKNKSEIIAKGNILIESSQYNYKLYTEELIYDLNKKFLSSTSPSKFNDDLGNEITSEFFSLQLDNEIIKARNIKISDNFNNNYFLDKAFLNLKNNILVGKDVFIKLDENNNDYFRIKGNSIKYEKNKSIINKAVLTPCKENENCPPWQLKAQKITHDKEKKIINYQNAWLEIYNKPVLYFPKFFHPDPTVDRQSGFLTPSIISSNNVGNAIEIPYFKVISENKDLTFKPRLYSNNKLLSQTEFRTVSKNFEHISDFSFLSEKFKSHKSHYFSKTNLFLETKKFDIAEMNLNIEQVSNDFYVKNYDLNSPIMDDDNILENNLNFEAFNKDLSFFAELALYENLNRDSSDRYEYIFPSYEFNNKMNISDKFKGDLYFNSSGSIKNYNTNIHERFIINDFIFNSEDKIINNFKNKFNLIAKNVNSDTRNSFAFKEKTDTNINFLAEYKSELPLIKENKSSKKYLTPKISLRFNPSKSKNKRSDLRTINYDNIFDLNRLSMNDTLEGGESLTYGVSYKYQNLDGKDIFETNLANVLRVNEEKSISKSSSLGEKTSDIITSMKYDPNEVFYLKYDLSLDKNLKNKKYQLLNTNLSINKFVSSFEYLNQSSEFSNESYLSSKISYNFNENNSISYKTRDNKKEKITEFYNLIYRYRNDCLEAAIEYNKDYYSFGDIKPEEKLFFKITIVPFGEAKGPNIYN